MIRPICQNDSKLPEEIQKAGCLFRSLTMLVEMAKGETLTSMEIVEQYEWLIEHGHMKDNCFVLDHEAVIKSAQFYLMMPQKAVYAFRQSDTGKGDFTLRTLATHFIRHVRTKNGYGHFYVSDISGRMVWDPYWPSPEPKETLTFRGYQL